jgi:hypothetical protein
LADGDQQPSAGLDGGVRICTLYASHFAQLLDAASDFAPNAQVAANTPVMRRILATVGPSIAHL